MEIGNLPNRIQSNDHKNDQRTQGNNGCIE